MANRRKLGPRTELRLQLLAFVFLCGLGALVARLYWVQVVNHNSYTKKLGNRSQVTVRIPSTRGEIRDRNGIPLVQNRASYEVAFYLPEMVRGYRQRTGSTPRLSYRSTDRYGNALTREEANIVQIVNSVVVPRLEELDLARDYNAKKLQRHYRNDTEVPFTYLEDIDFGTIARFSEHDVGLPGVDISIKPVRHYRYGALAAHLLGYVGAPLSVDNQPDVRDFNFYQPDMEGKSQIEQAMDKYLRGKPGVRVMQRNVKGVIEGEAKVVPPEPGNDVYLTIDARIQYIAEKALRAVGRGAAVVLEPNTGEILAMASVPSYDPNTFIPSISAKDWSTLRQDETDPLTNRAISAYAPGSTYKLVTSLAGLRKGFGTKTFFTCTGGVQYGNKFMQCWVVAKKMAPHGTITLSDALKYSCNAFFYQYGNAAGIDTIDAIGSALCLGEKTHIELTNESTGILPGPGWLHQYRPNERWSNGHTANVSIGQGYVLATPLQMANVAAAVANGGISYQPRIISKVLDQSGRLVLKEDGQPVVPKQPIARMNLHDSGVTQEQIELVRRGMWKVVNEPGGTAGRAKIKGVEVAGKTGTAQFWRNGKQDNHTWFICFAPYDAPKYAVCVFVQGAKSGGGVSAPIAAKILEESLALERGYDPQLAALEPAKGSFDFVEQVDYSNALPTQFGPDTDQETAEHTESPDRKLSEQDRQVTAEPDIRPEADAQGRVSNSQSISAPPKDRRNIFRRFFSKKPEPTPTPVRKARPAH